MEIKSLMHLRWTLTIATLIVSSHNLVGFIVGETPGYVYADEVVLMELGGHAGGNHTEVAVSTAGRRTIDSSDTQNTQDVHTKVEDSPFVPSGYELLWQEEFDGSDLDLKKWDYRSVGQSSDGSGYSVLSRDSVSVNGRGQLVLTTNEVDGVLQTGMISTTGRFEPLYGYFEARIRFQRQQGHHGAFWLKSTNYGKFPGDPQRAGVEIDIAEFFGSGRTDGGLGVNVYWNGKQGETVRRTAHCNLMPILQSDSGELCDRFHIFSLIWTSTQYEFFVDGHILFATEDGISNQGQPVILSLLSHKWEAEKLDRDKLDDVMLVDYVRVYQITPEKVGDRGWSSH